MALWQPAQSWLPGLSSTALAAEACGSWQAVQPFSATTLWMLLASFGTMLPWQLAHTWLGAPSSIFPCEEACGLWQPEQSRDFTGVWTKGFFRTSAKLPWQSRQIAPWAPLRSLNLASADWASPAAGRARAAAERRTVTALVIMLASLLRPGRVADVTAAPGEGGML